MTYFRDTIEHRFLFLLASSRSGGNSEQLARAAAAALPADVPQQWIDLNDAALARFHDRRHGAEPWMPQPNEGERALLEATLAARDIVIVAPVYWYGLPAVAKLYLDHWSAWLRVGDVDFLDRMRGKTLWAVSTQSADDRSLGKPLSDALKLTADYMGMRWGGHLLGIGNAPGDVLQDAEALATARHFFSRGTHDAAAAA